MRSFPWDSIVTGIEDGLPVFDRTYHAADLREVYKTFFSNGIFANEPDSFQVTPAEGEMAVLVAPGKCNIQGTIGWEGNERKLVLQGASGSADRIDTVVLRWNANNDTRDIELYVRTGTEQEIPVHPTLVRNDTVYELGLCDIYVSKGTGTIVQQRITDTRLDDARCGIVTPLLDIDTTSFFMQLQAQTKVAVELAQSAIDGTLYGQLQEQINTINANGWVTSDRIQNGAVSTEDIANSSITKAKLAQDVSTAITNTILVRRYSVKPSSVTSNNVEFAFDIPKISGYTPFAVSGVNLRNSYVFFSSFDIFSNSRISVMVRNPNGAQVDSTHRIIVSVVYARTGMIDINTSTIEI